MDRPKKGFSLPIAEWLRGSLRDWAEGLLDESRMRRDGYFHPKIIRKVWEDHLSGQRDFATTFGLCSCSRRGLTTGTNENSDQSRYLRWWKTSRFGRRWLTE